MTDANSRDSALRTLDALAIPTAPKSVFDCLRKYRGPSFAKSVEFVNSDFWLHVDPSSFSTRFGFLLWLKHLAEGVPPSYKEVGEAVGRSGVAVSAWRAMENAPIDYRLHEPLSRYFSASAKWIVDGEGDPPQPELWKVWLRSRQGVRPARADAKLADPKPHPRRRVPRTG